MSLSDRIHRANARSRRVPLLLFRLLVAWLLSAVVLAVLMPALHARGIALRAWMPWLVVTASLALCIGPELVVRLRRRG
jgi:hypothetical protein